MTTSKPGVVPSHDDSVYKLGFSLSQRYTFAKQARNIFNKAMASKNEDGLTPGEKCDIFFKIHCVLYECHRPMWEELLEATSEYTDVKLPVRTLEAKQMELPLEQTCHCGPSAMCVKRGGAHVSWPLNNIGQCAAGNDL